MFDGTVTATDLEDVFSHHPPENDLQKEQYHKIRKAGLAMATVIIENSPPSHDRNRAIEHVREGVMRANAAIALKGRI